MENSRITLGTVQLGLDYGVNNLLGKPGLKKSLEILDFAYKNKVYFLDTAFSYGDAEEIIGRFVRSRTIDKPLKVTSKLKPNIFSERLLDKNKYKIIRWEIEKSLAKMNLEYLDGYLLHSPQYIYDKEVVSALKKCKKEGLIKNFGVSIYDEKDALYAVTEAKVDYIQIPYSVFDQRLARTDFFKLARLKNVRVFARSAFLQGLVFMKDKDIPSHLKMAKSYLKKFDKIILKYGFSRAQAALLFSLSNCDIDQVVIGVDNLSQLKEDLDIAKSDIDFKNCRDELVSEFRYMKDSIIFPSLWSKNKK